MFDEAAARLEALGGQRVPINFEPMAEVARLLYESAFIAERYSGIRSFLEAPYVCPTPSRWAWCMQTLRSQLCARDCLCKPGCASRACPRHVVFHQPVKACLACGALLRMPAVRQGHMPTREQILADGRMERVTAAILSVVPRFSAADVYDGLTRLAELAARARTEFSRVDFLLVPSALHHYLVTGAAATPVCPYKVNGLPCVDTETAA